MACHILVSNAQILVLQRGFDWVNLHRPTMTLPMAPTSMVSIFVTAA